MPTAEVRKRAAMHAVKDALGVVAIVVALAAAFAIANYSTWMHYAAMFVACFLIEKVVQERVNRENAVIRQTLKDATASLQSGVEPVAQVVHHGVMLSNAAWCVAAWCQPQLDNDAAPEAFKRDLLLLIDLLPQEMLDPKDYRLDAAKEQARD